MDVLALTPADCRLLAARFAEHENSHRRMSGALRETGRAEVLGRLRALRRLERRFAVDLGSLCARLSQCGDVGDHPVERMVVDYVTCWRDGPDGARELLVLLDRIREIRGFMDEGQLARDL